jgi:flagellar hook protein FlgE
MVSAINAAVSGLAREGKRIQESANAIANAPTKPPEQADHVSLSTDAAHAQAAQQQQGKQAADVENQLIQLKTASYGFKANLITIKVADNIQKSLLDIKA